MRMLKAIVLLVLATTVRAQTAPAVRQIGRLERVSPDSVAFRSIAAAVAMPGGRVMINDLAARRVVLLDSTMSHLSAVADTTDATANAYGTSWATLIRYQGDSALLIVPSTLSMFVLGPNGATVRVMAVPRPNEAQALGGGFGPPTLDGHGRLLYFNGALPGIMTLTRGMQLVQDGKLTEIAQRLRQFGGEPPFSVGKLVVDSGKLTRVDLDSRALDTIAYVHVPKFMRDIKVDDEGKLELIATTPDPLPVIDQWAMLRDGTLAIVRGRDYHIDWIDASGKRTSSPKIPFEWERIDDARKTALVDSTVAFWQKLYEPDGAPRGGTTGGRAGATGGRGGAGTGSLGPRREPAPNIVVRAKLEDLPDYVPPFRERGVTSDADDNIWVETTQMVDGRPVYHVINRRGALIDRVQLPRFRTIAGFGPGVIYMAVAEDAGKVRLERARVR
jgi:hypothetical protein